MTQKELINLMSEMTRIHKNVLVRFIYKDLFQSSFLDNANELKLYAPSTVCSLGCGNLTQITFFSCHWQCVLDSQQNTECFASWT